LYVKAATEGLAGTHFTPVKMISESKEKRGGKKQKGYGPEPQGRKGPLYKPP